MLYKCYLLLICFTSAICCSHLELSPWVQISFEHYPYKTQLALQVISSQLVLRWEVPQALKKGELVQTKRDMPKLVGITFYH